jgi:regulator of sigma E protease|tara:strand:+ start:37 stop:1011 length:975 start_codon:yes stop_codon:yes gene_type:complete
MWVYGERYLPNENVKDGVWVTNQLAKNLGLQTGDKVLTVDGQKVKKFRGLALEFINGNTYQIERDGVVLDKEIPEDFISQLMDRKKEAGAFLSPRLPFIIAGISEDSPNIDADLQAKDIVTAINGSAIKYFDEVQNKLDTFKNQDISITVKRGNEIKDIPVKITNEGKLGVGFLQLPMTDLEKLGYFELADFEYSFLEAIPAGWHKSVKTITDYMKQLKKIFNPSTGAYKGLGGFISIGSIFPSEWSAQAFWEITAFLSIILGFMNLLPIPALDGGHVVFTLWEMITGRKPGDKFLEYAQVVGFILLIALLLFANGNDIFRLFS